MKIKISASPGKGKEALTGSGSTKKIGDRQNQMGFVSLSLLLLNLGTKCSRY